jgi:ubiquinone/menaquinone biosynthesis C-methylase UbiE
MALSTPKIITAAIAKCKDLKPEMAGDHLDVGAGHGDLILALRQAGATLRTRACDYSRHLMRVPDVTVDIVDLNEDKLPYPDSSFDFVTCTEVIEHIEHYRETLREIYRILRPDGVAVVTTPNILNLRSRIRFLMFGFYNLFGPLHMKESKRYSTGGHINPVSLFYLSHSLLDAGFREISVSVDKYQRGSVAAALALFPFIYFYSKVAIRRERTRFNTIDESNIPFVGKMNSWAILLGRTLVVGCRK